MTPFRILLAMFCVLVGIWLLAPTLVIIPMSFNEKKSLAFPPTGFSWQWYQNFFTSPDWSRSFWSSIKIAAIVSVLASLVGTLASLGLAKMQATSAGLLRAILITPMVVPGVVLAIGVYAVYLDLHLVGTTLGFVIVHTVLAVPFVLIAVSASLAVFDSRLETAAASLGASRFVTFRTITLPLIMPGILSGVLFAFVTSFDEILVALFITSPYLKTLPVQIYSSITRDADPTVAAVGTITFIATSVLICAGLVIGSKSKRS